VLASQSVGCKLQRVWRWSQVCILLFTVINTV
jgi:hypothetical protein